MSPISTMTIREWTSEIPAATRVFERLGIDYCCGGHRTLEEARHLSKMTPDQVMDALKMADQTERAARQDRDWQAEPVSAPIAHINPSPIHARATCPPRSLI
jgi:regulator of cell morphogenesis and NO signaling